MPHERLQVIASGNDQKAKTEAYKDFLDEAIQAASIPALNALVDHCKSLFFIQSWSCYLTLFQVVSESTPLVVSRIVLQEFANKVTTLASDVHVEVAKNAIIKIQSRVVAFEEQISILRENLSAIYEEEGDWVEAAKLLVGIPLESGQRWVVTFRFLRKYLQDLTYSHLEC